MENYSELGHRIKLRRKALGYTLRDVGNKVGTTATTIRRWEEGDVGSIKSTRLAALARALDTTPAYLIGYEDDPESALNRKEIPAVKQIPIVGLISAGKGIIANQEYEDLVTVPDNTSADFAVQVKGDSMINARIYDGDLVLIKEQSTVENGEIAAVFFEEQVVLKRVYKYIGRIELRSENPLYPPINLEGPDLPQAKILGKAVALIGAVR